MARTYSAEIHIDAPPEAVWAVLVDFPAYPSWNPFTREVRCTGVPGDMVKMKVDLGWSGVRKQAERLVEFGYPRIVWVMDVGADPVIGASRTQTVTPRPGGCTYRTDDHIFGAVSPLVDLLFGRVLNAGFAALATALRDEVLRRQAHSAPG